MTPEPIASNNMTIQFRNNLFIALAFFTAAKIPFSGHQHSLIKILCIQKVHHKEQLLKANEAMSS